jgi:putative FmdB family regulatory protein
MAMPMFDFLCGACGREFEDLVAPDALPSCPACGSEATRKLPSGPSVRGSRPAASRPAFPPGGG